MFNFTLKSYRKKRKKSASEVAGLVGLDIKTIYRYEAGQRTPRTEEVEKLAKFYRLSDTLNPYNIGNVPREVVDFGLIVLVCNSKKIEKEN